MRWGKKKSEPPIPTRGRRGSVRVTTDGRGRQWLECSACGMRKFNPGVTPSQFAARKHADTCTG